MSKRLSLKPIERAHFVLCCFAPAIILFASATHVGLADEPGKKTVMKGQQFLLRSQFASGWFSMSNEPTTTALAVRALVRSGVAPTSDAIKRSLAVLQESARHDGGFYDSNGRYPEIETCLVLLAFAECNLKMDTPLVKKSLDFLAPYQWISSDEITMNHSYFGGFGRGVLRRPNVSFTAHFVDLLLLLPEDNQFRQSRLGPALNFLERCQRSDGGFGPLPIRPSDTIGRWTEDQSFGHPTCDALRGLLVAQDNTKVAHALDWLGSNYDLQANPGLGKGGLFYYYHSLAKTLHRANIGVLTSDGHEHNWRNDLTNVLSQKQRADGSWRNDDERWNEDDPLICTAHALMALSHCRIHPPKFTLPAKTVMVGDPGQR